MLTEKETTAAVTDWFDGGDAYQRYATHLAADIQRKFAEVNGIRLSNQPPKEAP